MAVAYGEQRRRREAMDQLVGEIARADHEGGFSISMNILQISFHRIIIYKYTNPLKLQ